MRYICLLIGFVTIFKTDFCYSALLTEVEKDGLSIQTTAELIKNTNKLRGFFNENIKKAMMEDEYKKKFEHFAAMYEKMYSDKEYNYRFQVFCENMIKIELLKKLETGSAQYGVTKFSDLTVEEFNHKLSGVVKKNSDFDYELQEAEIPDIELPESFDWREHNAVTPVQDQGDCASCYAFSVNGNIEGLYAIKHKELVTLSEQEILDCDKYDLGCDGGYMVDTYRAIKDIGGLAEEKEYGPYLEYPEECHINKSSITVQIEGYRNVSSNETEMAQYLVENGPLSMGLNDFGMQFYHKGVQNLKWCDPTDINHGMVLVGFGVEKSEEDEPYWLIKNSWGKHFGEKGYYRIARGVGMCGMNTYVTTAIL